MRPLPLTRLPRTRPLRRADPGPAAQAPPCVGLWDRRRRHDQPVSSIISRDDGCAEAVTRDGDRPHEVALVIDPRADVVASRADRDHQGNEMILTRMRGTGCRRSSWLAFPAAADPSNEYYGPPGFASASLSPRPQLHYLLTANSKSGISDGRSLPAPARPSFPLLPTPSADASSSATRVPLAASYAVVSDGQRFILLRATAALRASHGKTVTVTRDAKGRPLVRPDPDKDIGL
jgi:hypothetical protein